ncbi:ABC transporter substrate-binding protein [Paenibacillus cremeus]|uniref:Extracellular solute-binding protein n=1 Tax=Paenibacillus cremeus TaxID=2163881 RepID=A0A559K5U6_9BACL|nr:extracellular solute-binding protein [Paenibacillus cremeus]TVY07504.1 extracellular solute-binding protein [Paenibacillus cremeus]
MALDNRKGSRRRSGIALLVIMMLLSMVLAACTDSEDKPANGKVKLTWMVWGSTETVEKATESLFKAYPEMKDKVEIEGLVGGAGDPDVAKKLRLALAANEDMPDIVMLNRTQLTEFAEAGILEDLTDVMKPVQGNLTQAAIELASYKNKFVTFPYEVKTKVWFYRKDMFDEAGIDPSKVKNIDDLIAAGKKLREKFPNSYIWNLGKQIAGYDLGMIVSGNGAKFTDDKGEYVIASDPGVRKAFEMFKQLKDSGVTVDINDFTPDWEKAFANGTIASSLISNWFKNFLPKYAPDQAGKWATAEWPILADADGGSEAGGSIFVIPAKGKHKKEAKEVLSKLLLTKQGALALNEIRSITPILKDALQDPQITQPHKFFGATLPQTEAKALEKVKVFSFSPAADLERSTMNEALSKYLTGGGTLDQILKQAETDLKNQVGNPYKKK